MINSIHTFFRYFVGILFIFSGLIKVNDPIGTSIKLTEYFEVFASDFTELFHYLIPVALPLAVILVVLEVVLGVALLINFKMPKTTSVLLLLIIFFTFLTFYSAYFEKVTDCGCFGDAIPLDPWESFYKDIVLLVMSLWLFLFRGKFDPILRPGTSWFIMILTTILSLWIAVHAINHLPFIDFRAYKIGTHIPSAMKQSEQLKYEYLVEKDGEIFTFDKYPTDTTYTYKQMNLLNPEAQPKITDYNVWNSEGDFTEYTFQGVKLIFIIENIEKTDRASIAKINDLIKVLKGAVKPIVLTATAENLYEPWRHELQLAIPYYYSDATVLKAMIRSNPGIILMKDGTVIGKWHYNDTPDASEIVDLL